MAAPVKACGHGRDSRALKEHGISGTDDCQRSEWEFENKIAQRDLRVSLLTPPGRGALAVVGVAGPDALKACARLFSPYGSVPLAARPGGRVIVGRWGNPECGEEMVVLRCSIDRWEIHCHGGLAASEAVLTNLERAGAVRQPWPEWLEESGGDLFEIESREALSRVAGPKAARILCRQLAGSLQAEFNRIEAMREAGDCGAVHRAVDRLRRASRVGLRLTKPWRVVVSGPVNAGKSSLVNSLAGYSRSIVTAHAGTTRDILETRIVLGGWEIDLIDTAGMRPADGCGRVSPVERAGIDRAIVAVHEADLVLEVRAPHAEPFPFPATASGVKRIAVVSKADLQPTGPSPADAILTSAVTGEGIDMLVSAIAKALVPEDIEDPTLLAGAVPFTQRHVRILDACA